MPLQRGPYPAFRARGWQGGSLSREGPCPICLFRSVTVCPQAGVTLRWPWGHHREGGGVSPLPQETTTPRGMAKPLPQPRVLAPHEDDVFPSLQMSEGQKWPLSMLPCPSTGWGGSRGSPQVSPRLSWLPLANKPIPRSSQSTGLR